MATEDVSKKVSARNVAVERKNLITVCRSVPRKEEPSRGQLDSARARCSRRPFVLCRFVGFVSVGLLLCLYNNNNNNYLVLVGALFVLSLLA